MKTRCKITKKNKIHSLANGWFGVRRLYRWIWWTDEWNWYRQRNVSNILYFSQKKIIIRSLNLVGQMSFMQLICLSIKLMKISNNFCIRNISLASISRNEKGKFAHFTCFQLCEWYQLFVGEFGNFPFLFRCIHSHPSEMVNGNYVLRLEYVYINISKKLGKIKRRIANK